MIFLTLKITFLAPKTIFLTLKMIFLTHKTIFLTPKMIFLTLKMSFLVPKMISNAFMTLIPNAPIPSLLSTFAAHTNQPANQRQQKSLSAHPALTHGMRTFVHLI